MKSSYLSVCVCLLAIFACASLASADVYTWNTVTPGTYNWGDASQWTSTPGGAPNGVDAVADFTKAIACINGNDNQVFEDLNLNTAITVGSLTVRNGSAYNGNTTGTYDMGDGHGNMYRFYAGSGGSLNFQVSTGTALLKEWLNDAYGTFTWTLNAPVNLISNTVIDTASVTQQGFCNYNGPGALASGIILNSALGGSGALIKTGNSTLWINSTNNAFSGNVSVQDGYLFVMDMTSLGTGTNAISLGGPGSIGHLTNSWNNWAQFNLTRPITLTGEGGGIDSNFSNPFNVATTIGGTGTFIVGKSQGNVIFTNPADNTYVGQARVQSATADIQVPNLIFTGNVTVEDGGYLRLNDANNVGGTVTVNSCLPLGSPLATTLMSSIGTKGNFFPTLSSSSNGIIDITQDSGGNSAFNAALAVGAPQLGNGYMVYGQQQGGNGVVSPTFRGASLQPNLDNTYRFAMGYNGYLQLAAGGTGVLADVGGNACNVEVSKSSVDGNGWETLRTYDANSFTGTLTINGLACFTGYTQASGSPFGSATGAVALNGGFLELQNGGGLPVTKGDTTFQGQSLIGVQNASLTLNTLTRLNNGILAVRPEGSNDNNGPGLGLGTTDKLYVANSPPAVNNGMVAPWMVEDFGRYFLTYDATTGGNGFIPATFTVTGNATGGGAFTSTATDILNLPSGGTISGAQSAYAVRVTGPWNAPGALLSNSPSDVLTIGSGGLILATTAGGGTVNHTANINFGTAEGIIYLAPSTYNGGAYDWWEIWNKLSGTLTGTNGLTIGSYINGNHASWLEISGTNTGLTGQINIVGTAVAMDNPNALGPATNTIYINGRLADGGNVPGAALLVNYSGTLANPIIVGPMGGTISNGWWTNITLTGQISGTGPLNLTGTHDTQIWISNNSATTPNNYTGGTWITGTNVYVNSGASLGTGPIIVGGFSDGGSHLTLLDNVNVGPTQRVIIQDTYFDDTVGVVIQCAAPTFGSLEGNGKLWFNTNSTLTVGGNNASTDFFGTIADNSQQYANYNWNAGGSLIKTGTGTLTLWGDVLLAGCWPNSWTHNAAVTVNQGTLVINGTLDSPVDPSVSANYNSGVTVNSTGTLTGSGVINKSVTVNGGAVNFTGATVTGPVVQYSGTYSGTSTITGNDLEVWNGTFSGTHTINLNTNPVNFPNIVGWGAVDLGSVEVLGGTLGGNNIITAPGGVYTNRDDMEAAGTIQGSGTINANVHIWGGTYNGTHTIHGNVDVQDYWYWDTYYPMASTFAGAATIYGNVTLGTHNPGNYVYPGDTSPDSTSSTSPASITFKGGHTIHGNLTVASGNTQPITIAPHNDTLSASTLTVVGNVTLDHNTTLNFNLASPGTSGSGINDLIDITGNLSLDGTLNVNNLSGFGAGTYRLFNYTGTLAGSLAQGTMPTGLGYNYTIDTSMAGQVNLGVASPFKPGDVNHDGVLTELDIDWIYEYMRGVGVHPLSQCDVNHDGSVSQADVTYELTQYMHTNYGDANLDHYTDFTDFQVLLDHWQAPGGWTQGDFNGDGVVDFLDFQVLLDYWNPGGWSVGTSQVPEPATLSLLALGGLALLRRSRK